MRRDYVELLIKRTTRGECANHRSDAGPIAVSPADGGCAPEARPAQPALYAVFAPDPADRIAVALATQKSIRIGWRQNQSYGFLECFNLFPLRAANSYA